MRGRENGKNNFICKLRFLEGFEVFEVVDEELYFFSFERVDGLWPVHIFPF